LSAPTAPRQAARPGSAAKVNSRSALPGPAPGASVGVSCQPRPSAASYDPMAAAGSNTARSNPDLRKRVDAATAEVAAREGVAPSDVPAELVTQSGGGLDPHLTPAGARVQVARVAKARGLDPRVVQQAVDAATEAPQFGVLGQPRVNVLRLNLALDAQAR